MFAIFNLVIPIFIIIGIGYFAIARRFLSQTALRGMGRFVVTFALPALIFQAIISQPIGAIMNPVYFLGYAGGSLISFFIGFAIAKLRRQTSVAAVVNGLGQSALSAVPCCGPWLAIEQGFSSHSTSWWKICSFCRSF